MLTAGGGSKNPMWTRMRERILGVSRWSICPARARVWADFLQTCAHIQVPTARADETDAAYGAALLALKTLEAANARAPRP